MIQKFDFIKRDDKGQITTVKDLEKADVSSVSPSSERMTKGSKERLTLETSAF